MARKKKRDDLVPTPEQPVTSPAPDINRQPRILGWLVLIAGASSTWYWYRPLPPIVQETTNATLPGNWPTSQSGPRSLWSEQGLVAPNLSAIPEPIQASPSDLLNHPNDGSHLVGTPKVTLTPSNDWNEPRQDIREALKTEKIPLVPVEALTAPAPLLQGPKLWTPDPQETSVSSLKPVRSAWPDQGYVPKPNPAKEQHRAATKITTPIPPLLEAGMRTIRTNDEVDPILSLPIVTSTSPTSPTPSAPDRMPRQEPPRQPNFIRQPTAKPNQ